MGRDREEPSIPDVADRHRRLIALAMLALGTRYALTASTFFVDPGLASTLGRLGDGFALLAVGLVIPVFLWKARNLSRERLHLYRDDDGFMARTMLQAHAGSWTLAFLVLILVELLDERSAGLPPVFLAELLLAVMLVSFAVIFLYLDSASRRGSAGADDA